MVWIINVNTIGLYDQKTETDNTEADKYKSHKVLPGVVLFTTIGFSLLFRIFSVL